MRIPFTSRVRAERAIAHARDAVARADGRLQANARTLNNARSLIRKMYEPHKPYPGRWAEIGNYGSGKEWWCEACRTHWPCKPWRELRRLYSATYGPGIPEPTPEMEDRRAAQAGSRRPKVDPVTWLRLSINVELGRPEPEPDPPHDTAVDALVYHGPPPEQRPIGFCPPSDPTRHPED